MAQGGDRTTACRIYIRIVRTKKAIFVFVFLTKKRTSALRKSPVRRCDGVFVNLVGERVDGVDDDGAQDDHAHKHHADGHHLLQVAVLPLVQYLD